MSISDVEHYFVLNILIEYTNFIDMFIVGIASRICRERAAVARFFGRRQLRKT